MCEPPLGDRGKGPGVDRREPGKAALELNGKQRRYLRSLGHHLEPVVQLGKHGLTDGVVSAVSEALERHELVKVRLGTECPDDRKDVAERLAPATNSSLAGLVGRTMLLYRRHPKEPKIVLPKPDAKKPA